MQTVDFNHLQLRPGERVLDLGCGEGRHAIAAAFAADVNVIGLDISMDDLVKARYKRDDFFIDGQQQQRLQLIQASGVLLPFADHSFDVVICSEVLEHIVDYQLVVREIARVLKPEGTLAVSVPRYWPEKICWQLRTEYHQVPGGHIRIFTTGQLKQAVVASGFQFMYRHWAHALHAPYWWLKCVLWSRQDNHWLLRHYHRLLVWDLMHKPRITRLLETCLNPLLGKSVVLYFRKNTLL